MTKREFAAKLYVELYQKRDALIIVDRIRAVKIDDKPLSVDEQLEITNLIKQIHIERSKGLFEDVSAFLDLVNQVEEQIKAQNNSN